MTQNRSTKYYQETNTILSELIKIQNIHNVSSNFRNSVRILCTSKSTNSHRLNEKSN